MEKTLFEKVGHIVTATLIGFLIGTSFALFISVQIIKIICNYN